MGHAARCVTHIRCGHVRARGRAARCLLDLLGPPGRCSGCWPHNGEVAGGRRRHFFLADRCWRILVRGRRARRRATYCRYGYPAYGYGYPAYGYGAAYAMPHAVVPAYGCGCPCTCGGCVRRFNDSARFTFGRSVCSFRFPLLAHRPGSNVSCHGRCQSLGEPDVRRMKSGE